MAIEASEVYWKHPELYDAEASAARRDAGRMPALPNLKLCRSAEESMAINLLRGGAIIIAGSGMCSGGRIVHHLKHNITQRECDVIFTGFQAVGTLGRAIVDGREHVRIHGEKFKVNARIHTLGGFSAHGDQEDLLRWHAGVGAIPARTWCTAKQRVRTGCVMRCAQRERRRRWRNLRRGSISPAPVGTEARRFDCRLRRLVPRRRSGHSCGRW